MPISPIEIGRRLKEIRQFLNLSQKEFAEQIEIHQSLLSDMENGKRNISYSTLISLITFNSSININYLLKGTPPILIDDIYHNDIYHIQNPPKKSIHNDNIWIEPRDLEKMIKKNHHQQRFF
jgi:transcriptional regulator with XRE-family HTH domain